MSAEEILRESAATAAAEAMVRKYYGSVNLSLKPLLATGELPTVDDENALGGWREARQATEGLRAEAERFSADYLEQQRRLVDLTSAHTLTKAGFKLELGAFGLPPRATSGHAQELAARSALEETNAALSDRLTQLDPFMAALRQRVTLALRLALANGNVFSPAAASEVAESARLLAAVGAEMPRAHQIGLKLGAFALLAQNRGNHSDPGEVDKAVFVSPSRTGNLPRAVRLSDSFCRCPAVASSTLDHVSLTSPCQGSGSAW